MLKRVPLERRTPLKASATTKKGKPSLRRGRGFSASPAQQAKVALEPCAVCRVDALHGALIDPAHIAARGGMGGCDDPLCVIALCRKHHDLLDKEPYNGFDLLPFVAGRYVPELQHALGHYNGNLIALLERLTGCHWSPSTTEESLR